MLRAGARTWLATLTLAAIALAALTTAGSAQAAPALQGGTTVAVSPGQTDLTCGETAVVDIRIADVEDLFGVDVKVGFDPNVVEVVDALEAQTGINVQPGDLPDATNGQGMIQVNAVDEAGIISYAATRLNPNPAQSGAGVIISITFKGVAAGSSDITLESVTLSDDTARPIAADTTNGTVRVTCDGSTPVPTDEPDPDPTDVPDPDPTDVPDPGGKPTDGGKTCTHIIKPGETLFSIARYYGVTVASLASANGIGNPNTIYAGQRLRIPGCGGTGQPNTPGKPTTPGTGCSTHVVKPGESLSGIAYMHGDSVAGIAKRNGIANPNLVWAGQRLTVCGGGYSPPSPPVPGKPGWGKPMPGKPGSGGVCRYTHIVKPGETLFSIAYRYGSSVYAVQAASGLANPNLIYAGQALCIP